MYEGQCNYNAHTFGIGTKEKQYKRWVVLQFLFVSADLKGMRDYAIDPSAGSGQCRAGLQISSGHSL
eukprot:scaffold854_cov173-Alexandrium_tamarense.AAC.3